MEKEIGLLRVIYHKYVGHVQILHQQEVMNDKYSYSLIFFFNQNFETLVLWILMANLILSQIKESHEALLFFFYRGI